MADEKAVYSIDHDILTDFKPKQSLLDLKKNPLLISILEGCDTLKQMMAENKIPMESLSTAKGLLLMKTDKIGFGISITQGYGLVVARLPGTTYGWGGRESECTQRASSPEGGKGAGESARADSASGQRVMEGPGAHATTRRRTTPPVSNRVVRCRAWPPASLITASTASRQTLICLATDKDIQAFTADKRAYKIGLDFGINLGDQVNESAALNTQTGQTCDVTGVKTKVFTLSKGYLVDVSMQGTSVEPDKDDIKAAYGPDVTPSDVLGGRIPAPREAKLLYKQLRTSFGFC
ncbi:MAG: hypothetical protein WDW38_007126 [Sanguina aurantia]